MGRSQRELIATVRLNDSNTLLMNYIYCLEIILYGNRSGNGGLLKVMVLIERVRNDDAFWQIEESLLMDITC